MFEFDPAIATTFPKGIRLLTLLHECATVRFRLELQGVAAFGTIEQAGEQVCAATCVLGLDSAAFKQRDDPCVFLRGLDRWMSIFNDDSGFTWDYFERRSFTFLVQSTTRFAVDDATEMHFIQDEPVQHAFRPQFAFRGRDAATVKLSADAAARGTAQNPLLHEVVDIQFLGIYIQAVGF
ncbi:hypothetical protein AYW79_13075 [Ferroacidibacillus organovorans]|uniref:Uncharacterized protein n=1 Tax=Ferroacidibacillus organovorans TaxID=1765683 RepID=A0A853K7M4_9BACL|nr:hypothetical protein AYJ22_13500 [Ferroacidibacillus organovorans]OAG92866.1 hypothetical protein AYW79_13075 [Ferroacidibacillus organovorans]